MSTAERKFAWPHNPPSWDAAEAIAVQNNIGCCPYGVSRMGLTYASVCMAVMEPKSISCSTKAFP